MAVELLIALGANISHDWAQNAATLGTAVTEIARAFGNAPRLSQLYRSEAFPAGSGPDYANAALAIETDLSPDEALARLHAIEAGHGRTRNVRWGARSLDLDLIAAGDAIRPDAATLRRWMDLPIARQTEEAPDQLILPHPRLQDRAFVLVPLAEVAPDWRHPLSGQSVTVMRDALPQADIAALRRESWP